MCLSGRLGRHLFNAALAAVLTKRGFYGLVRHHCNSGGRVVYLHRLALWLCLALACFAWTSADASFPATGNTNGCSGSGTCYEYGVFHFASATFTYGYQSGASACAASAADGSGWSANYNFAVADSSAYHCVLTGTNKSDGAFAFSNDYGNGQRVFTPSYSCPADATLSGSTCTCASGFAETNGQCRSTASVALAALNALSDPRVWIKGGQPSTTFCEGGNLVTGTVSMATYDGTQSIVYGPFHDGGGTCTAVDGSRAVDTSVTCASGTYPGVVNGLAVCSPSASTNSVQAPSSTVAPTPSGSASAPVSAIPNAPVGSVRSDENVTCDVAQCIKVTNYSDGAGASTGTKTDIVPKTTFCQDNPLSPICKQSAYSAAPCGSPPSCSGDAIQCAIAADAFKTACFMGPVPDSAQTAYDAASGLTGDQTSALPGNQSVAIGPTSFSQTELLGTPAGVQDLHLTIIGNSWTVPLSMINPSLTWLGYIAVACTLIICSRVVMGVV